MQLQARLPAHLRQYVVEQDYGAYTSEDQAVWRFVVLQTHARHLRTAHPAYAEGFEAVGISVEEIPQIIRMNERLEACGFQAVCVDGFIPPRAFQAFQARGLLPIAADIRTSQHLTYTPAPDIIHEAAGHAPLLAHPDYARFLRAIGQAGERAFASKHDRDVYDAIHSLSELKEDPASTAAQIEAAQRRLEALGALELPPSEAALLSRLYWWTVEYGLIGQVDDYRIYGAGLLSSIGEGHFCYGPEVQKLPLGAACIDVPYDITRPQPQLFVARDFEQLRQVLDEVCAGFAFRVGGERALLQAHASGEPATLELGDGVQLAGLVTKLHRDGDRVCCVELQRDCAVALDGVVLDALRRCPHYILPLGYWLDGTPLTQMTSDRLLALRDREGGVRLSLQGGIEVTGQLLRPELRADRAFMLLLGDCTIRRGGVQLLHSTEPYPLLLATQVSTAHAALPAGYYPPTELPQIKVPKPRVFSSEQQQLIALYDEALSALRTDTGASLVRRFERVHAVLKARYAEEWLLRWNLLESLSKLGAGAAVAAELTQELEDLELRFAEREPIATGLAYLRSTYRTEGP